MFNTLYRKYKVDVLGIISPWISLKEMKVYEKACLSIVIFGAFLTVVSTHFQIELLEIGAILCILIAGGTLGIGQNMKSEQRRIVNDIIQPSACKRMKLVVQLLKDFEIDIYDEKQLDRLIARARKEQEEYDFWKDVRPLFDRIATYVFIPIFTIFLSDLLKDVELVLLIKRSLVVMCLCILIVMIFPLFSFIFNGILNSDKNNLEKFINDIEDVKIFSKTLLELHSE
ncbi:hypothetical protein SAMN02910371_03744 [Butyrivibrio sp. INlla14]|nr:hypothetical protein SAMN02910371_03744 [Butyrivibrio sp. INlla14]